jgi:hypothetical protein
LVYLFGFSRIFLLGILVFKGLTARRVYKSFGVKGLMIYSISVSEAKDFQHSYNKSISSLLSKKVRRSSVGHYRLPSLYHIAVNVLSICHTSSLHVNPILASQFHSCSIHLSDTSLVVSYRRPAYALSCTWCV